MGRRVRLPPDRRAAGRHWGGRAAERAGRGARHVSSSNPVPSRGENWYQFRHALIRDALYDERLPQPSRPLARGDRRAARKTRPGGSDEHGRRTRLPCGAIGSARGRRSMSADSLDWLASELLAGHAFDGALAHFERAWRARNAWTARRRRRTAACRAWAARGQRRRFGGIDEEAWNHLRRALDYYLRMSATSRARWRRRLTHRCRPRASSGSPTSSTVYCRWCRTTHRRLVSCSPARLRRSTSKVAIWCAPQRAFARALAIASRHQDAALELRVLAYGMSVAHFSLRWLDVLAGSRRLLALAQRAEDLYSETYARYRAAFVLTHLGRSVEAPGGGAG